VIYINSSTRRNLGVEDDEDITQLTLMDFYAPQAQETLLNVAIPAAIRDGSWSGESAVINRKDGRVIPVSLVGVVHRGSDGTPEFMSGVNRDISDRKRFEAEIQQAREAAETANRAKSTFLANMSHEIRTPMNAIIGMTSLLLETALNVKQRDFVETIRVSGDGLLTIINDILDFSKIEADKLELVYRPLDVRDCIESSLDLLAPHAAEKNLDMAYVMDPSTPTGIVGDVTRLRQVLVNLIGNAVKFTRAGEVVVTVTANPAPNPDSQMKNRHILHFTVRDTGIGIPQDKRDRLFKSFSQIDSSNTREFGGTGLGLAISKRLVELMGGAMWVESEGLGRGSTFHFTIVAEAIPALHQTNLQRPQPELRGKRVLIVDDNATNRRILSLQTQTWGMQAHEVETPADALHLLARSSFDVAILDMHMPEMDGLQLARAIQQSGVAQTMPLIMLTSVSLNQEMSDLFQASLTKPVKPSELYNILLNVLVGSPSETLKTYHQLNSVSQNVQPLAERYPMRILLAEDVVVNQKFALHALERIGYRADVVANGAEAVAALQRQPYHVILMDVQMPVMDGLEATRRIRTLDVIQPHIIAMTANAMQGDREICLEAGMDDYISKPVYLHELQAALERAGDRLSARMSLTEFTETPELDIMQFVDEDIIAAFVEEIPQITERLRRGVETGNAKEIRLAAHQIKGSCAYVGAKQVEELSAMLEQMGRDNYLVDAPRIFAQLEAALVIVLSQWVK
jgi:PAS domain S-box-containing protein